MNKREWLETINGNIASLVGMSESHPEIFNNVVSEKELEQLEETASNLAANLKAQIDERGDDMAVIIQSDNTEPKKPSVVLIGESATSRHPSG